MHAAVQALRHWKYRRSGRDNGFGSDGIMTDLCV